MIGLPTEILATGIAGYLLPSDAIKLNNTCKKLHSKLSLTAIAPRPLIAKFIRGDHNDDAHYGFQIWVPDQVSCHSILLSMRWKDQGWGNCKGKIFVVANEKNPLLCNDDDDDDDDRSGEMLFGGGRVVYTSATAPHEEQRLDVEFQPSKENINETSYHVWYIVGGGGGHSLNLSSVTTQALVFDDPLRSFGKAYNFLAKTQVLSAYDNKRGPPSSTTMSVHLDVEQFVQTHGEHLLTPLISFADDRYNDDDDVSEADLHHQKVLGFIQSIWESWAKQYLEYAKRMAESRPTQQVLDQFLQRLGAMQVDDFVEDRMDFGEFVVAGEDDL